MKKVFLLLTLIATTFSAWGVTVSKTVGQLKGDQTWSNEQYNVAMDDAITIDYGKYSSNSQGGEFRYYYQQNTPASKFTLIAKAGVIINTVKFTYNVFVENTVLTDAYYSGYVPDGHVFEVGTPYNINASSKTFHVGRTAGNGGTLCLTKIEVTYSLASPELKFAKEEVNVCKNVASFINPLQNKGDGAVTYSGGSSSVATVAADGTITVKGVGSTTITATTNATSLYKSESKSYTINVSSDLAPSPLATQDYTLKRSFGAVTEQMNLVHWNTSYGNPLVLNNVITATTANTGYRRDSSNNAIRVYSSNGEIKFKARDGAIIKSIKLTWNSTTGNGVLTKKPNGGYSIKDVDKIVSGTTYTINANSVSYWVGSTWAAAQNTSSSSISIGLSEFEIVYSDPNSVVERYSGLTSLSAADSETTFDGDNKLYKWKVRNCATSASQLINNVRGIYVKYNSSANEGYLAMNGGQEGGVKDISYEYITANKSLRYHFFIKQGSTNLDEYLHKGPAQGTYVYNYNKTLGVSSNSAISIVNPKQESPQNVYFTMSPISITPYLLFNVANHAATFNVEQGTTCDLNSALINNTGATPTFTVEENTAGGNPQITNGILDFSSVVRTGTIKVQAAWGSVTTTLTLTINLKDPEISFGKTTDTKMITDVTYKQVLTSELSSGAVTYSLFSAPEGATIDADGTVHFSTAGEYVVKGMLAAALPYAEDTATYTLTVTELKVPTLKFDTSYVEKPVGAAAFTNAFSKPDDDEGAVTYASNATGVATVDENSGEVSIVAAGTATITASVAETSKYAAGNKSYTLKVFPLSEISFADGDKDVYLNADPFTYAVTKTAGDGEITYSSSAESIATVDANGKVTLTGTASGSVTITAIIAKTENYWTDTASYKIEVSSLKLPTASYSTTEVNKNQNDVPFENTTLQTTSDGAKSYESSDERVATVDENGLVTLGEKPGSTTITAKIAATAEWEKIEAQYTLNVSSAPIEDMHPVSKTVADIKQSDWENGKEYSNVSIDDKLTLSKCKYYTTGQGGESRYYYNANPLYVSSTTFTIQAKAGVIIKSVKFTYNQGNANMILADGNYGDNVVAEAHRIISGETYKVDANAVTYYVGRIGATSSNNYINISTFEITYFDPSEGVAVTKMVNDLGKSEGLDNDHSYKNIAVNQAISLCTNDDGNLKYYTSGVLNCYRHKGAIEIKARPGATIHHVKITYTATEGCLLTKYKGTGFSILPVDQIASDSILYVNANSIKLDVGTSQSSVTGWPSISITKIYVNYTDNSEVTVDNFNKCTQTSGDSVVVAGVDGKYDWTFKKFSRKDTITNRMYYDQSVLINKGGKIMTEYTGGLQEVAFDWHPTESGKAVYFTVTAGDSSWNVTKTAADMNKVYTFNFQKTAIKSNGEFSISVDGTSGTTVEIGHVSLTPYLLYACMDTTIAAKDYKAAGWKFIGPSLINYTGETITYTVSGENADKIASVDANGVVTILGGGTVMVNATAATAGVTASYQLTINLEATAVEFEYHEVPKLLTYGEHTQPLTITQAPDTGRHITYSIDGSPATASVDGNGRVTYSAEGNYTVRGRLEQNLPYAASEDTYVLKVTKAPNPDIKYEVDSLSKDLHDAAFINTLSSKADVGDTTYLSTNESVATVDATGLVTIVGIGKTTIKAMVEENTKYAADTASYLLYVLPLPQMTFANSDTTVYLNTTTFTNTLTVTPDSCVVSSYESSNEAVASVDANGVVTRGTSGTAIITARTTKNKAYSAGSASYNVTVVPQYMTKASFQNAKMEMYQNDEPFSNPLIVDPQSVGARTYSSSDEQVATVTNEGVITMRGRVGKTIITANVAETATYLPCSATFELTAKSAPVPGGETVTGNIATIATAGGWQNDQYRTWFKIDENISVSSADNNSQYLSSDQSVRFYQKTNKGQFTIRAKAGIIIQAVKFTYTATNNGVITNNYGTNGQSIAAANQYVSGTTYKVDGNKLVFYTGSTAANSDADVHIKGIEVKYFVPQEGIAETKKAIDLGKEHNLTEKQCYQNVALNNVITIHADATNTLKYFATGFNCYRHTGSIDINARPGTIIHFVKISYSPTKAGYVLTKYWGANGCNIPEKDQIASDSILYVNANSLKLRVGYANSEVGYDGVSISKIYVLYSDTTAIVDDFDNLTATYGGDEPTEVAGVDGVYNWKVTQFNRDSLRRIGYDQSTMLRNGDQLGKIETVGDEGGVKEVSFDWCASNSNQAVKFDVKVGTVSETVSLAATSGWYPRTYTKTGVKQNGKFSIEVNSASGSQLEFNHISLMPYLLYTTKEATLNLKEATTFQMAPQIDNRDDEAAITYSFVEDDVTFAEINSTTGLVTATDSGKVTVKAAWSSNTGVYTTYQLTILPNAYVVKSGETLSTNTLAEGASVTINNGGTLNVDDYTTLGSVYAKEGGNITINAASLTIKDFYISATMSETGTSGQIAELGENQLYITGAAYFDMTIPASNHAEGNTVADQWHAFTVPFPVDMINGIFNAADDSKLTNEKDYAIMVYQGDVRAQGKYGWIKVPKTGSTILQPGTFYIMTINGDVETFRMKMYGNGFTRPATSLPVHQYAQSGSGTTTDAGWNGIGNSQLNYRYVNATVQVLDPSTYTYVQKTASDAAHFSVGTPFFYQASADGSIELATSVPSSVAARAMSNEIKEVAVTLANEKYTDRLLISATEEATNEYQIGKDLVKMSMTSTPAVPQIFALAYNNTKLCMVDAPMVNNEATYALSLYAPKAGEYTIACAQVAGYEIYLTLNGEVIWNLSMNDYKATLANGDNKAYGLILKKIPGTTTSIDGVRGSEQGIQKFIYDERLVIIRDGQVYNGAGAWIK